MIRGRSILIIVILLLLISFEIAFAQNNYSKYSGSTNFKFNMQESVLNRWFRIGLISGIQQADSPVGSTEMFYGAAIHGLIYRNENIESYLTLEGAYARGTENITIDVDEDESVDFRALDTQTYNLSLKMVGINWAKGNPLKIFPYTTLGVGIVSRPKRSKIVTRNFNVFEYEDVEAKIADAGKNALGVNLGVGFQIYYLLRLDFQVFLVNKSGLALYRSGVEIIF